MKRIVSFLLFIILYIPVLLGQKFIPQTTYYNGEDYIYQLDLIKETGIISLYNKENIFVNKDLVYKTTGEQPAIGYPEQRIEDDTWTRPKCFSIVNEAFAGLDKSKFVGKTMSVSLYIDSTTGKIVDVEFGFPTWFPYKDVPISVYRDIELGLKKNVWFIPTEAGKKMNYIYLFWMHEVR